VTESPTPAAEPPARPANNGRTRLIGIAVGVVCYVAAALVAPTIESKEYAYAAYAVLAVGVTAVLLVAGIAMLFPRNTQVFATGLLIGVAIGVFVGSGICIGLLSMTS
jgi:hypothetical protein